LRQLSKQVRTNILIDGQITKYKWRIFHPNAYRIASFFPFSFSLNEIYLHMTPESTEKLKLNLGYLRQAQKEMGKCHFSK
jgi:hypothetical protein